MPKHAPSFKHLLGSVTHREVRRDPTVAELLASSRQQQALAPIQVQEPDIHPAELLRREREEHNAERRRVAGPAPPKSWWKRREEAPVLVSVHQPSEAEVRDAIDFLNDPSSSSKRTGVPSLSTICSELTVQLLCDGTEVEGERIADIVLPAVLQLEPHLRQRLLEVARGRLADEQVRAILRHRPESPELSSKEAADWEEDADWDAEDDAPITALAMPAHASPGRLLKSLGPALGFLTSVNLAFCRVPELGKLPLPGGLRALSLRGVYSGQGAEDEWAARGLALLGERLILLATLDLSYAPALLSQRHVVASRALFPSLKVLGLRGAPDGGNRIRSADGARVRFLDRVVY